MTTARSIYFHQTSMTKWIATCGTATVATIEETVEDAEYRVVYRRTPSANPRNPNKTTRTLRGSLEQAQNRIIARGW